jgi:predicted transcriptional regulator YdeE
METFDLENDFIVFCNKAQSFPEGVLLAHQTLHKLVEYNPRRNYFGISYPQQGGEIIYFAAAEEIEENELQKHQLTPLTIAKGSYIYIDIIDFMNDIPAIGQAFQRLIQHPYIDPNGQCIEWYKEQNKCRCMVKLKKQ